MIERLFVYGTLGPGRPNEHVMLEIGGTWNPGVVVGRLYQLGWGADLGYPGIVLDENGMEVEGHVFESSNLSAHWVRLDEFEGDAYKRVLTEVRLEDGERVEAFIYEIQVD